MGPSIMSLVLAWEPQLKALFRVGAGSVCVCVCMRVGTGNCLEAAGRWRAARLIKIMDRKPQVGADNNKLNRE